VHGAEVEDIAYGAPDGDVRACLVQPDGRTRAVVLWMHWFGEETNTNRTEFIADGRPDAYVLMTPDATFANWFVKYLLGGRGSASEYQAAFAPLDPVSNVGDAAPGSVFFQFAKSDPYVPGYIADKLMAASAAAKEREYDGGHELDAKARADRIVWLREKLGLQLRDADELLLLLRRVGPRAREAVHPGPVRVGILGDGHVGLVAAPCLERRRLEGAAVGE
jgi:hypothetical protein